MSHSFSRKPRQPKTRVEQMYDGYLGNNRKSQKTTFSKKKRVKRLVMFHISYIFFCNTCIYIKTSHYKRCEVHDRLYQIKNL